MLNPQLNTNGELQHLLTIEGLPQAVITHILDTASSFVGVSDREVKKVPLMRGKSVFNLFFENSTRTRTTFEIAAKRLSADVINLIFVPPVFFHINSIDNSSVNIQRNIISGRNPERKRILPLTVRYKMAAVIRTQ